MSVVLQRELDIDAVGLAGREDLVPLACDAEVQRNGPLAADVLALCELVAAEHAADRARRWAELEPTIVHFEELDA